jgi:hypothetical protein
VVGEHDFEEGDAAAVLGEGVADAPGVGVAEGVV